MAEDLTPNLSELIQTVHSRAPAASALEQLMVATAYADDLNALADNLVGHFVTLARHEGASWTQIGDALGVSKQGAQQRFVPKGPVDASDFANKKLFSRFTDRARGVVLHAQEEARERKHNYIGTEHVLLGLLKEDEGVAAHAVIELGVSLDAVRSLVESRVPAAGSETPSEHIPFTPRAKTVLELTMREALKLGHNYIGTEHIILAILAEHDGLAGKALRDLGIDYEAMHTKIAEIIGRFSANVDE